MRYTLIAILILTLSSCTRYQWVSSQVKITINKDRIKVEQLGKPRPLKDTVIIGNMILRQKY